MNVGPGGAELYHADGWTDGHDRDDINFLKGMRQIVYFGLSVLQL